MINEIKKKMKLIYEQKAVLEKEALEAGTDHEKIANIGRQLSEITTSVEVFAKYEQAENKMLEAIELEKDSEMLELALEEETDARREMAKYEKELEEIFFPRDPEANKDVIMEIRPGTGGEEASLFASELARAYLRFAEKKGLSPKIIDKQETESGGLKEMILEIEGKGAFSLFRFEGGVHRVQRIPKTESQGRIHTSAVSVVAIPRAEEKELNINEADLRFDTFRSSGPGGQSVNTTDSAVRVTHIPTGTVVSCQDQKSQLQNKLKAIIILRSRLLAAEQAKKAERESAKRLSQIGSGDRSDKIRTYNFPQDRITDHRLTDKKNFSGINNIMNGNMDNIVETLQKAMIEENNI